MLLTPREIDKLVLHGAGYLAQKRLARGLRLSYTEAVALIAAQLLELIRDGRSVAELMDIGRRMLGRAHLLPGVAAMIREVQVEGTFEDGTRMVTVHEPIATDRGNLSLALHGSFLPVPPMFDLPAEEPHPPGAMAVAPGKPEINRGRGPTELVLVNRGGESNRQGARDAKKPIR